MTIQDYRKALGMSRAAMSREFGIPIRTLENWDAGKNAPPPWAEQLLIRELKRMLESRES